MKKKGAMKISTLIIGLVLLSLFASIFGLAIYEGATNYGTEVNQSEFTAFNKMSSIKTDTENLRNETYEISTSTSALDRIGAMFEAGYNILKASFTSLDMTTDLVGEGVERLNLGITANYFKNALILLIAIAFIFIVVSAIVKKDL